MSDAPSQTLLEALLDSWDHNNTILLNLLRALPEGGLETVEGRLESGRNMDLHYDHPILMLHHMIWHEGYHHGQIKLALKLAGRPMTDDKAGPVTWSVWMNKTST
jgi:hypothetical protein